VTSGNGTGIELRADMMLIGYHRQDLDARGAGSATTVGVGLSYDYRRELIGPWVDRLGLMHLPGLALDHHVRFPRGGVRARLRANPDFSGAHPGSYHAWEDLYPDAIEKTVLEKHGYYYGWGATGRLEVEATLPRVSLGGTISYTWIDSQEGLDRAQEDVDLDVELGDTVLLSEAWLRIAPLGGRLYLEGRYTREDRDGSVGEVDSTRSLTRLGFSIGAAL
jgi:hypothetical protein